MLWGLGAPPSHTIPSLRRYPRAAVCLCVAPLGWSGDPLSLYIACNAVIRVQPGWGMDLLAMVWKEMGSGIRTAWFPCVPCVGMWERGRDLCRG